MDKIIKFLSRLTHRERERVTGAVIDIVKGEVSSYNRKKMKGCANLFRIRVGDIRIVYLELDGERRIVLVDRRNNNPCRDFLYYPNCFPTTYTSIML